MRDMRHDDLLFAKLARNILQGHWLGKYDLLTHVKGPGYPIFIAVIRWLHLPLLATQQLFYAAASLMVIFALRPLKLSLSVQAVIFTLLWWNPVSFVMTRLERDNLFTILLLMLGAQTLALIVRRHDRIRQLWPWAVGWGVTYGCMAITREEGGIRLIVPFVVGIVVALLWKSANSRQQRMGRLAIVLALASLGAFGLPSTIRAINYHHYGVWLVSDLAEGSFPRAYGAFQRIAVPYVNPRIIVPKAARQMAYDVSPAAASIQPFFEGTNGWARRWGVHGRAFTGELWETGEVTGVWFQWALRSAANSAGYHQDAVKAQTFYARMAREIEAAGENGDLPWFDGRTGLAPRWRPEFLKVIVPWTVFGVQKVIEWKMRNDLVGMPTKRAVRATYYEATGNRQKWISLDGSMPATLKRHQALKFVASMYRWLMPIALAGGMFVMGRRISIGRFSPLDYATIVILVGWGLRFAFLVFMCATSFYAFAPRYLAPGYSLLVLAAILPWVESISSRRA